MATVTEYLDLIPSANRNQPKFTASLSVVLEGLVAVMNTLESMPAAFDIDTAIGAQLDAVGVRVGLSRRLPVPIEGVYFSFGIEGVGFGEGVWRGPNDPTDAIALLDDETYRAALRIKIAANSWNGTVAGAQALLASLSGGGTYMFMQDNFDMSGTVIVSGVIPSALFKSLLRQLLIVFKPGGVELRTIFASSVSGAPVFGFGLDNDYIGGFGHGAWAQTY